MVYDEKFQYWFCPKCKGEFWEDSEQLQELRQITLETQQAIRHKEMFRYHIMSISAQKILLPPVCVWIKGSSGHRKTGKKPRKKRRSNDALAFLYDFH